MTFKTIATKSFCLALILFFSSLFIRTLWLDKIPIGIISDNMIFVLNAKAVYYTGHDVSGIWNPLSFTTIPDEPAQAELPYAFLAPVIGPLPSSLFSAHIFYAVLSSLLVIVLFLIVKKLLGIYPAFIVGLVTSFNPWNIFFGRAAFEAPLALFFYLSALYILMKTAGWKKLFALIPLILGFSSYMAYKITLLPYVFIISFFTWNQIDHKKYTKQYITLFALCLLVFFAFLINAKRQNIERMSETTFFSINEIEKQVNAERQISLESRMSNILSNKASIGAKHILAKYYNAFSLRYLFIENEETLRFHLFNHGYFYYLDVLFLFLGFYYLFINKKKLGIFLISILLISPLPSVVSNVGVSYAMRSSLYIPFFCIFIGIGIWYFLTIFKNRKYTIIATLFITGTYILLIANFLHTYFFIQPVYGSEASAFSARLFSAYVSLSQKNNKPLVFVNEGPKNLFKYYAYYSGSYNKETSHKFKEAFYTHDYSFKNITFTKCKNVKKIDKNTVYVVDPGEKCSLFKNLKPYLSIVQLHDSGEVYRIYQDKICSDYSLKPFVGKLKMDDLTVENLSLKQFCERFIIDYKNK